MQQQADARLEQSAHCKRMSNILSWIYVSAAVVLLFGAAVFVHEWGHYAMALLRGLKVEAFAIGFGPKIFGWRKRGIDYSWRWIPAGVFNSRLAAAASSVSSGIVSQSA